MELTVSHIHFCPYTFLIIKLLARGEWININWLCNRRDYLRKELQQYNNLTLGLFWCCNWIMDVTTIHQVQKTIWIAFTATKLLMDANMLGSLNTFPFHWRNDIEPYRVKALRRLLAVLESHSSRWSQHCYQIISPL